MIGWLAVFRFDRQRKDAAALTLVVRVNALGVEEDEGAAGAVGGGARDGRAPHPEALGAGAVRRADGKAARAAEELVEHVGLALARAAGDGDDAAGAARGAEGRERLGAADEGVCGGVEADELERAAGGGAGEGGRRRGRGVGRGRGGGAARPEVAGHARASSGRWRGARAIGGGDLRVCQALRATRDARRCRWSDAASRRDACALGARVGAVAIWALQLACLEKVLGELPLLLSSTPTLHHLNPSLSPLTATQSTHNRAAAAARERACGGAGGERAGRNA